MVLEDYKEIVGSSAMYTTIAQMLSGTLICIDIYKKGTTKGVDSMPFLGGIGLCSLMLRYAWMLDDINMKIVNIFGFLINTIYMTVYYYYAPNTVPPWTQTLLKFAFFNFYLINTVYYTREILKLIGKIAIFVIMFLVYAQVEHPANVEFRFGIVITVLLFLLIAAPFAHLKEVIKTKNTDILPFPLIFTGTLVCFQWLLYGIIINNVFIIFQNTVGFILSIVQLSLFVIFPSKKSQAKLLNEEIKED